MSERREGSICLWYNKLYCEEGCPNYGPAEREEVRMDIVIDLSLTTGEWYDDHSVEVQSEMRLACFQQKQKSMPSSIMSVLA